MLTINRTSFNTNIPPRQQQVAFKGNPVKSVQNAVKVVKNAGEGLIAKGLDPLAKSDTMKYLTENIKMDTFNRWVIPAGSTLLSGTYVIQTLRSKTIESDRKKTLATNMALVWGMSTAAALVIDKKINKGIETFIEKFGKANPDINYIKMKNAVKFMKSAVVFGTMYRLIAPVIATPLADKFSKKFFKEKQK